MTKVIHKSYNQNGSLLLPPSLGELIPSAHPVRIISDILDRCDINEIESTYKDGTKIESVANKYTFVWKGCVEKNKAKLIEKVKGVLSAAEEELAVEETCCEPDELPQEEFERRANKRPDQKYF